MEISGAATATRKKKPTIQAETTPERSRLKRRHISCPGERPTGAPAAAGTASSGALPAVLREGLVIACIPRQVVSVPGVLITE